MKGDHREPQESLESLVKTELMVRTVKTENKAHGAKQGVLAEMVKRVKRAIKVIRETGVHKAHQVKMPSKTLIYSLVLLIQLLRKTIN